MEDERPPHDPDADSAYRFGVVAGAVLGLITVGSLHWTGALTPLALGYVLAALFPVYLIVAAVVLGAWPGYDEGATSLRPVGGTK